MITFGYTVLAALEDADDDDGDDDDRDGRHHRHHQVQVRQEVHDCGLQGRIHYFLDPFVSETGSRIRIRNRIRNTAFWGFKGY